MSYRLSVRDGFAAAHRLVGSGGKCEALHGHNFRVTLRVVGQNLDEAGMLVDFGRLKGVLKEIIGQLDHSDLNSHPAFTKDSPSSENIARFIWKLAEERLSVEGVEVESVTVSESETASATYEPGRGR
ncbi:MAG: 6-carboxytetrahydropterin synthase QueD [bacterium]|nr:MAG: 6-carboxytetrahydropterin synthase QueD [bacterium]